MISEEQVRHVANLARLGLTDDEIEKMGGQLDAILDSIEKIQELDLAEVPPTANPLDLSNVLRPITITLPIVRALKCFRSAGMCHGSLPLRPITPSVRPAGTMNDTSRMAVKVSSGRRSPIRLPRSRALFRVENCFL